MGGWPGYKFVKTERKGLPPVARVEKVVGWQEGDQEDDTAVLKVVFTPWMDHIMLIHGNVAASMGLSPVYEQ